MNTGSADASKKSKNIKRLVQEKLPTRHISDSSSSTHNKFLFKDVYQDVRRPMIRTAVLSMTKGRLRLCCNSNHELDGYKASPVSVNLG